MTTDGTDADSQASVASPIPLGNGWVVELRFFVGLSVDETAEVLETSRRSVLREWNADASERKPEAELDLAWCGGS